MTTRKEPPEETLRDPIKAAIAATFLAMGGHPREALRLFGAATEKCNGGVSEDK